MVKIFKKVVLASSKFSKLFDEWDSSFISLIQIMKKEKFVDNKELNEFESFWENWSGYLKDIKNSMDE